MYMINQKEAAKYIYDFIVEIIDKHGPRLPGSEEEAASVKDIKAHMYAATGVKPKVEEFKLAPTASIGAIPMLGAAGMVSLALYYLHPAASLVASFMVLAYAIIQVFLYRGWFDRFFKQHTSHNIYSVMDGGKDIDYTIVFSGHYDSSWNWNMSLKHPLMMIPKTVYGVVGVVVVLVASLLRLILGMGSLSNTSLFFIITPLCFIPGLCFLCYYLSYDKKKASPGAMDDLTGVGMALYMGKYYRENPDKLPKNCRVIVAALGSEEAGLKGSMAFMDKHADDKNLLINPYFINLDSLRDYDNFNAVKGDSWQFTKFDNDMCNMVVKAFENAGVKPHVISNPVGGCDSTPIVKKGFKTITIAAQTPTATNYYHTYNDKPEGLDMRTLEKSVGIIIDVAEQIGEHHANNEYKLVKYKKSK